MANTLLALEGASLVLADGRTLFPPITEIFAPGRTGIVGANGVGKSLLARMLAGQLQPTHGHCRRQGLVHYLPQQAGLHAQGCVADLAGLAPVLLALERIAQGLGDAADFDTVGERWDLAQSLRQRLHRYGLSQVHGHTLLAQLSGGQRMRAALAMAALADADVVILDEPSNHLDGMARQALMLQIDEMAERGQTLVLVSHDRQLLEHMDTIMELSPQGLRRHGGAYGSYALAKAEQEARAGRELAHYKAQKKRQEKAIAEQQDRQQRRQAQGQQQAQQANQAAILLGRQKQRSQASAGRRQLLVQDQVQALTQQVREAAQRLAPQTPVLVRAPAHTGHAQRLLVQLEQVQLPWGSAAHARLDLIISGQQRLAVVGPNGSGKSSLLRVLSGQLAPQQGRVERHGPMACLDQDLSGLQPASTVLEQLQAVNSSQSQAQLRTWLAQMGLGAAQINRPCAQLSGGERLKAALACALYADPPAQCLLLDEPSNHLDLEAVQALESMLRQYQGALVVVSHDPVFLEQLELSHRLQLDDTGFVLQPW